MRRSYVSKVLVACIIVTAAGGPVLFKWGNAHAAGLPYFGYHERALQGEPCPDEPQLELDFHCEYEITVELPIDLEPEEEQQLMSCINSAAQQVSSSCRPQAEGIRNDAEADLLNCCDEEGHIIYECVQQVTDWARQALENLCNNCTAELNRKIRQCLGDEGGSY